MLLRELSSRDGWLIPAAAVLGTALIGVGAHLAGTLPRFVTKGRGAGLGGSMEDSVNATLGFAGVYVPLVSAVVCVLPLLPDHAAMVVGVTLSGLAGIFPCVYLPWAISATHPNTPWTRAALSLGAGVVAIYVAATVLA